MLGFFSGKSGHPLAEARELARVCQELGAHEPADALEAAVPWLESVFAAGDLRLPQRFGIAAALDESVQRQAAALAARAMGSTGMDARLAGIGHDYWNAVQLAYGGVLLRVRLQDREASSLKDKLALIIGRQLHAMGQQLKWLQFRYMQMPDSFWADAGGILLAAGPLAAAAAALYPGKAAVTPESTYLKLLVFHVSSMDTLRPDRVELADRLIDRFLPRFSLLRESRPDSVWWADLAKPLPPMRLARLPEPSATLRFFSGGEALASVEAARRELNASGAVPRDLPAIREADPVCVAEVLDHLALCWAPKPPMRSHDRRRVATRLYVVSGFEGVAQRIAGTETGVRGIMEWAVEDVSLGGMGAQLPLTPVAGGGRLGVGTLVAMQPEGGSNWLLGVIRRFQRKKANHGAAGIETLSKAPRAVAASAGSVRSTALLLDPLVPAEHVRVVLAPAAFELGVPVEFLLDGDARALYPAEIIEAGEDFVLASFYVPVTSSAAAASPISGGTP